MPRGQAFRSLRRARWRARWSRQLANARHRRLARPDTLRQRCARPTRGGMRARHIHGACGGSWGKRERIRLRRARQRRQNGRMMGPRAPCAAHIHRTSPAYRAPGRISTHKPNDNALRGGGHGPARRGPRGPFRHRHTQIARLSASSTPPQPYCFRVARCSCGRASSLRSRGSSSLCAAPAGRARPASYTLSMPDKAAFCQALRLNRPLSPVIYRLVPHPTAYRTFVRRPPRCRFRYAILRTGGARYH